jgi:putative ATP-binding cassette transporter
MNLLRFLLRASRGVVVLSVAAGVVSGVGGVALIALIHTELGRTGTPGRGLGWAFAGLALVTVLARGVAQGSMVRLAQRSVTALGLHLCRKILALPLRRFEESDPAALLATLTEDVVVVSNALVGIPLICINLPIVVACFAYAAWLSMPVFLYGVLFAIPGIVGSQTLTGRGLAHLKAARDGQDALVAHFRALIDGFRELKVHRGRREAFLAESLPAAARVVRERSIAGLTTYALATGWSQLAFFGFLGFLLFVLPALHPVGRDTLTGAVLVVLFIMSPLDVVLNWLPMLGRAGAALDKIQALIPTLEARGVDEGSTAAPLAFRESIRLDGISYAYGGEPDGDGFVLGPVDLAVRRGEVVFLVGGNGSGKTTLVKLLTGLYHPDDGAVRLDDRPIGESDSEAYRQLFSVVFADGYLFPTLLGLDPAVVEARADEELARLGLGRHVRIEEGAFSTVDLSQGQRRRLALLVACLEDRPICVFDEWAAHQDPHFKKVFYLELLPELRARGKTLIVITHDEDYFATADRVVKLHDGLASEEAQFASEDERT